MNVLEIAIPILLIAAIVYMALEYNLFSLPKKGLPVLMYHNISDGLADGLNIPAARLEEQLKYLRENGYKSLSLQDLGALVKSGEKPPKRSFMLTFDDAYESMETRLLPLLDRYGFCAVIFVPVAFIGKTNMWDDGKMQILSAGSLHSLSRHPRVEIGLHSFLHRSFGAMDAADMEQDLINCRQTMVYFRIPFMNALAYPYGAFPKKDPRRKKEMAEVFERFGLEFAFRIGNRINGFPLKNRYEVNRIDIKGNDSFFVFRTKLRKGRVRVFA